MKLLNNIGPRTDPWGMPLATSCRLNFVPLITAHRYFTSTDFDTRLRDLGGLRADLTDKDQIKAVLRSFSFCMSFVIRFPASLNNRLTVSLVIFSLLMYLKQPFLLPFTSLVTFNFSWTLSFLASSLHAWQCPSVPPQISLCFNLLHTSFLTMRLIRSSLFRQAGFLPHPLGFLQSRVCRSCALKKIPLKINHLFWGSLFPLGQFQIPEHAEICCPKVQDFYSAVHLAYFSQGLKLHHLMGSVAKAAINCRIPDWFLLICK